VDLLAEGYQDWQLPLHSLQQACNQNHENVAC
jgi:hypothetical protein